VGVDEVAVMPLLPPLPYERHTCTPPLEHYAPPAPKEATRVPAVDSTWDCSGCGRVWIVVKARLKRQEHGYSPQEPKEWVHASRREARRHIDRTRTASPEAMASYLDGNDD
jgi:hypothetical protein